MKKTLLLLLTLMCSVMTWAQDPDWSVTSFSGSVSGNSTTINEATWTLSDMTVGSNANGEPAWSISSGKWKFGSGKNQYWSSYTLSTNKFNSYNITKVEVGCYDNGGTESSVTAKQGSVTIGTADVSTTTTSNVATLNANQGEGGALQIIFTSTKQASYITSIKVWYTLGGDAVHVESVTLDKHNLTIMATKSATLTATVAPVNATNTNVSWSSSDEDVATVDKGVVKALKEGTTTITVTTADGNKTDQCEVTVTAKAAPAGAKFYESFDKLDGVGGNDGTWSGISGTYAWDSEACDNTGWTTEGTMNKGKQCASIRKGSSDGTSISSGLTTPAIGVAGDGNVTFNAQAWGTDTGDFYVDIVGGGTFTAASGVYLSNNGTTAKVTLTKKSEWKDYNLSFTGLTADSKFRFYMAAGKRGFLDEVAVFVTPTFASLDDLIAAEQSFDAVNVTINDEIFTTMADSEDNAYAVVFKNKAALSAFGEDQGWKAGGKVTGTLSNVKWNYMGPGEVVGNLICPSTVWDALEYTAPEVQTFNSIEELLGANLPSGTAVNVTINGTIKEAKYNDGGGRNYYAVQLEGDFILGAMFVPDYGWKRGGTISGTLENVTYYDEIDEETGERERGVIGTAGDIFAGLDYVAPVTTYTFDALSFVAQDEDEYYWATFSSDKDVFMDADNIIAYAVTVDDSKLVLNDNAFVSETLDAGDGEMDGIWIPANTGVLIMSSENEVPYYTVDYADVAAITADNMLRPASVAKEAEGFKFYKLAYASSAKDGLGFYWGAAEGAAFASREGSAYLAVPAEVAGSAKSGFKFDDDTATGINNVKAEAATGVAYNLAGQRVNASVKGIVIMNGKKFINK